MADTDSLDRPDLDAAEKILDFPCGLPKYDQRKLISYARSLESQLAERPSADTILDFEWHEGRPHTAHRQHQFYYDCAVCQGDVQAMLTLTRPE